MKEKENILIISIILFPFILALLVLRFINFLKSSLYDYLIIILSIVFLFYFIESIFLIVDDIIESKNKKRIIFVFLFPFLYIPFYYYQNISKSEKYLSYFIVLLDIGLLIAFYFSFSKIFSEYIINNGKEDFVIKEKFAYADKDNNFTIQIDKNYRCDSSIEGYAIACDNIENDSFIGIYSYEDENFNQGKLDDIMEFHIEDILRVISENNYESDLEFYDNYLKIKYNDMEVLLVQKNYFFPNRGFSLIFVMETKEKETAMNYLEKVMESIQFLQGI